MKTTTFSRRLAHRSGGASLASIPPAARQQMHTVCSSFATSRQRFPFCHFRRPPSPLLPTALPQAASRPPQRGRRGSAACAGGTRGGRRLPGETGRCGGPRRPDGRQRQSRRPGGRGVRGGEGWPLARGRGRRPRPPLPINAALPGERVGVAGGRHGRGGGVPCRRCRRHAAAVTARSPASARTTGRPVRGTRG